jgi:prepilin-type N-terminal cleavage/methylation domain-containing protein
MGNKQKAFSLLEMMVVLAIVAILAKISYPKFLGYRAHAAQQTAIVSLKSAYQVYQIEFAKQNGAPGQAGILNLLDFPQDAPYQIDWSGYPLISASTQSPPCPGASLNDSVAIDLTNGALTYTPISCP